MTRKRFIKLMMAEGIGIRGVRALAACVSAAGTYERLYSASRLVYGTLPRAIEALNRAWNELIKDVSEA